MRNIMMFFFLYYCVFLVKSLYIVTNVVHETKTPNYKCCGTVYCFEQMLRQKLKYNKMECWK